MAQVAVPHPEQRHHRDQAAGLSGSLRTLSDEDTPAAGAHAEVMSTTYDAEQMAQDIAMGRPVAPCPVCGQRTNKALLARLGSCQHCADEPKPE